MQQQPAKPEARASGNHQRRIDAVLRPLARPTPKAEHSPPRSFRRAEPLGVEIAVGGPVDAVTLLSRRTNQVEPWRAQPMQREGSQHRATIAAEYTDSEFPLQYYFELRLGSAPGAVLFPGFDATWSNQPYFVVRPV